jgi:hypothetical protein
MEKPIIFNLDDFCEEYMTREKWDLLFELNRMSPELKITMFTIPLKNTHHWLAFVKEKYGEWIKMALHGTDHKESDTFFEDYDAQVAMNLFNPAYYIKGFKAPKWRLGKPAYDYFRKYGFWVATNKTNDFVKPDDDLNFKYDEGKEIIKDMLYETPDSFRLHGHITQAPNGISEAFEKFCSIVKKHHAYKFIGE